MAKINLTFELHLSDEVEFVKDGERHYGRVQDLSWLPEVWVETGIPGETTGSNPYKRHLLYITDLSSVKDKTDIKFDEGEEISYIYVDNGSRKITTAIKR